MKDNQTDIVLSGDADNAARAEAAAIFLPEDSDADVGASAAAFAARMPVLEQGAVLLPGRTRACCFWVSIMVPDDTAYIVDSTQIPAAGWRYNQAKQQVPEDALLVIINPRYEDHIRKAMATFQKVPHPSVVAARIIDSQCRKDPTLAERMKWRVA